MTATCTDPQFNWMFNSRGQSPCEIAQQLASACGTGDGGIPNPLPPNTEYPPLASNDANPCTCNTVRYSMIVACSACQSRSYPLYADYTKACSQTYNQEFPATIPAGTSVPHYAYLALIDGQFWWPNAHADTNPNESTGGGPPSPSTTKQEQTTIVVTNSAGSKTTVTTQVHSPTTEKQNTPVTSPQITNPPGTTNAANTTPAQGTGLTTNSESNGITSVFSSSIGVQSGSTQPTSGSGPPQAVSGASSSSSKAGPIAGGVVGGLGVLCLFLAFLWWLRHRERVLDGDVRPSSTSQMAQNQERDAGVFEPPPYMSPGPASVIPSNEPVPFRKPAPVPRNAGQTSGHRPLLSEGGSSTVITGYTNSSLI